MGRLSLKHWIRLLMIGWLGPWGWAGGPSEEPVPGIQLIQGAGSSREGWLEVIGLNPSLVEDIRKAGFSREQWQTVFHVFLGDGIPANFDQRPPILGAYFVEDGKILFQPRFPFIPGRTHQAGFDLNRVYLLLGLKQKQNLPRLELAYTIPEPDIAPATRVTRIYPGSDRVPANLLKFYIHFSASISRGNVYDHIRLLDAAGNRVRAPFLEVPQELWDPETKRLTLFFHPGRIKQGLRPHEQEGLALKVGARYRLVIDRTLKDFRGVPLKQAFEKTFTVVAEDRVSPDFRAWRIGAPRPGNTEPLTLDFDEPLDQALLLRMLLVKDAGGKVVDGNITISENETHWTFQPREPWSPGQYTIEVDADLEDRAGNTVTRLFDMPMESGRRAHSGPRSISLVFTIADKEP